MVDLVLVKFAKKKEKEEVGRRCYRPLEPIEKVSRKRSMNFVTNCSEHN